MVQQSLYLFLAANNIFSEQYLFFYKLGDKINKTDNIEAIFVMLCQIYFTFSDRLGWRDWAGREEIGAGWEDQ